MSTNSAIALRSGDTFQTIYCHWNGHPKDMLPVLRENYNSFELASDLISFGDASYIAERLEPTEGVEHTFDHPEDGVSVFYYRDRGEDLYSCQSVCYTRKELFSCMDVEYVYIFEDGQWNAYYMNGRRINK